MSNGRRGLAVLLAAGVALATAPASLARRVEFHGLVVQPPQAVVDFVLSDQHGRRFSMREQRGRAVLLMFGYTHCVDVCPAALGMLKRVHAALGRDAVRVRVVFVTTDPARDTPQRLKAYLALFHPDIVGLTGPRASLARVHGEYLIYPERYTAAESSAGYRVSHATAVYLIDPAGVLRFSYPWGASPSDLVDDVRQLLVGH